VLWASFAYLILQPAVRAPRALSGTLAGFAAGEPGWLAALDRGTAAAAGSHALAISVMLAIVFVFIAAGILFPATARPALALAMIAGLAIWVAGENFGGILTGAGTDPNSGPLLILLAAAYWPLPSKISPDPGTADLATRRLAGVRLADAVGLPGGPGPPRRQVISEWRREQEQYPG
jgi:hypothetical protein